MAKDSIIVSSRYFLLSTTFQKTMHVQEAANIFPNPIAKEEVRIDRITSRKRNISDVTEVIAREQSNYDLGEIAWARIDSAGPKAETFEACRQVIDVR